MEFKLYHEFNRELELEWLEFENQGNLYAFQTYDWNRLWSQIFSVKSTLFIYIIYYNRKPISLIPLVKYSKYGCRFLEFIGGTQSDYSSLIFSKYFYENNVSVEKMWSYFQSILTNYDYLYLDKIPEKTTEGLINPIVNLQGFTKSYTSYSTSIQGTFEDFAAKLRAKLKSDINRQVRRLEGLGSLDFILKVSGSEIDYNLRILYNQKSQQYIRTGVRDTLDSNLVKEFYVRMLKSQHASFKPILSLLKLNDKVIASHLGMMHGGRFYYLLPAYNYDYQVYSPGKILLNHLIKESINMNLTNFDFTIGGEEYKKEWCDEELVLYRFKRHIGIRGYLIKLILEFIDLIKRNPKWRNNITHINRFIRGGK